MSHIFCFGHGYSAGYASRALQSAGWTISGTSSSANGVERLKNAGITSHLFDGRSSSDGIAAALRQATHILLSIPPGPAGDPAFLLHGDDIAASPSIRWIGYFSTVGVYGDAQGGWVDEGTPPRPMSERGQRRLAAERDWLELGARAAKSVAVFRLPGIYGPGRSALEDVLAGTARRIVKPGQVFNRIHVEDIAAAVLASIANPHPGRVYNITDDEPGPPQDVVSHAARLLGMPPPPEVDFDPAQLSAMARSFYGESKRVSNARMKRELGVTLRHPTYREGLETIWRSRR